MKALEKAYRSLIFLGGFLQSPLLLLCRLYWGGLFMMGGWGKLSDIAKFTQFLENSHFILPDFTAYLVALTELVGGLFLLVGFAARLAAIPLIITMLTAYFTVHIASIYALLQNPKIFVAESPFNFLLASLLILAFGPGRFSIDYLLEKRFFSHEKKIRLRG